MPANALSYNLVNEPTYYTYGSDEAYAAFANDLIAAIRQNDTEKLIVSDGMLNGIWHNACPSTPLQIT